LPSKPLDEIYCQGEAPVCGNGIVESKEACDGGEQCSSDCKTKCADNEVWKNGKCEVPAKPPEPLPPVCAEGELLIKGICLKSSVDAKVLKSNYSTAERPSIIVRLGSQNTFFLQIYAQKGVRNDEDNMNNSQFWQKQYGDNIVDHYEVLDSVNKVYEVFLPPLKIFEGNGENMQIFYRVETFKYAAGNLVDPSHIYYQSFNLTTRKQEYKFHRSPRGVETLAKINYAPYTNQWIDENGNHYVPGHGQYACGPTSAMMAAGAKGKLSSTDYASLRSYVFDDSKWNAEGISQNEKSCGTYSGAFARVMESCGYLATDWSKLKSMYNNVNGEIQIN
jgi:hypothetical protein